MKRSAAYALLVMVGVLMFAAGALRPGWALMVAGAVLLVGGLLGLWRIQAAEYRALARLPGGARPARHRRDDRGRRGHEPRGR